MIDSEDFEGKSFEAEDDSDVRDIADTFRIFWEVFVNIINLIRNCILLALTSSEKIFSNSACPPCCSIKNILEQHELISMPTFSPGLKYSPRIDFKCERKSVSSFRNKAIDFNEVKFETMIENQLKDFCQMQLNDERKDKEASRRKKKSSRANTPEYINTHRISTYAELVKCDVFGNNFEELDTNTITRYKEEIQKYSRITYSDFTSLFNKFVKENGRDFSKNDLSNWYGNFTRFIYLKKALNGVPTDLREQLSFRAIQSKKKFLVERLYMVRDSHEKDETLEEFSEHLRKSHIEPIHQFLNMIQGGGDTCMNQNKKIDSPKKLSADDKEQESKTLQPNQIECNDGKDPSENAHNSRKVSDEFNEIRQETIDLERETVNHQVNKNEPPQEVPIKVKSKNRKKSASNTQKNPSGQKVDLELLTTQNNTESALVKQNPEVNPLDPKHLPPFKEQRKFINSTIYITKNGLVKVSQYIITKQTKQVPTPQACEKSRTLKFYVDHLDEEEPLPEGIEVKPLPPGGLSEIFRAAPPVSDNEYDELVGTGCSQAKERCTFEEACANKGKLVKTAKDVEEPIAKTISKDKASEVNKAQPTKAQLQNSKPLQKNQTPPKKPVSKEELSVKEHTSLCITNQKSNKNGMTGTKTSETEPGSKMRRFVPAKRRLKSQSRNETEDQAKEEVQVQNANSNQEQTIPFRKQNIFDQLRPLKFIDTDIKKEAVKPKQKQVYLETTATIDYSRHIVEPSHGDRPNKKKLQAEIKEKIKTKGEANKHLKAQEKHTYHFDDDTVDEAEYTDVQDSEKEELNDSVMETTDETSAASPIVNATDQPQILDNREYMMVPEEIIRITDPRLKDIEDKYSIGGHNDKKDKKKRKEKRGKAKKSIPIKLVSDL